MIDPCSTSMPVLAVINLFEVEDGKVKEEIYWTAFWTKRTIENSEDEEALKKRIDASIRLTTRMAEIGYHPGDPQILMKKLTENLVRCQPIRDNDEALTAVEVSEFEADVAEQRQQGLDLTDESRQAMNTTIGKILWQESSLNTHGSEYPPSTPPASGTFEDFGIDSLGILNSQSAIEEEFSISVEDEVLYFTTFGQLYDYIYEKTRG